MPDEDQEKYVFRVTSFGKEGSLKNIEKSTQIEENITICNAKSSSFT